MLIHFISNNIQIVFDGQISDDLQFFQCKDFATWVGRVAENQAFTPSCFMASSSTLASKLNSGGFNGT